MSNPFKNFSIPFARPRSSKMDLSGQLVTTGEFGQLVPVKIIETIPGDHFNINLSLFSRCAPLISPCFSDAYITTRAFFIPNRCSWNYWNEFITNQKIYNPSGNIENASLPKIKISELMKVFIGIEPYGDSDMVQYVSDTPSYDEQLEKRCDIYLYDPNHVVTPSTTDNFVGYTFNPKGRYWYKVLTNLGYKFNWAINDDKDVFVSALPLLAFLHIYQDYYLPSQYATADRSDLVEYLKDVFLSNNPNGITHNHINLMIDTINLSYDSDYFVSAWKSPNNVLGNYNYINNNTNQVHSPITYDSVHSPSTLSVAVSTSNQAQNAGQILNTSVSYNSDLLRVVNAVTNFVTRNNYAGSRAVEQILARFGIRLPDVNLNRSVYLGSSSTALQISDVTNLAESDNYKLGSFGGKALAADGNFNITYDVKEHGFIVIMSTILPKVRYYQGRPRYMLHTNQLDFYTPEFDKVGMQAISSSELYAIGTNYKETRYLSQGNALTSNVFGYVPRYTEYRTGDDNISGDFLVKTKNESLDSFHMFRELPIPDDDNKLIAQGKFIYYENGFNKTSQYNRIFNVTNGDYDHFYMIYNFKITATRPMLSNSETVYFDHDNGNTGNVQTSPNGNNLN